MSHSAIVLLFAAATFAEGNLMPWEQIPAVVKQFADSNGRRLNAACYDACPKAKDMMESGFKCKETYVYQGEERCMELDFNNILCQHDEAISCMVKAKACQDESPKYDINANVTQWEMLTCMCACPDYALLGPKGKNDLTENEPTAEQCKVIGCLMAEAKCGYFHKSTMNKTCSAETSPAAPHAAPVVLMVLSVAALFA